MDDRIVVPIQSNAIQSNAIQSNAMQSNANQQEESMNSSGVSHLATHLDHGSIVRYRGSLQLVEEFGLDSVIRVRHIDCRCSSVIQSFSLTNQDTSRWMDDVRW